MNRNRLKKIILDILVILMGNFCIALAVAFFVIPNKLLVGGTAGIAEREREQTDLRTRREYGLVHPCRAS